MSPPEAGTLLDGGWVVEQPLREGATGIELRCHHQDDPGRRATVKLYRDVSAQSWGRFQREAEILVKVQHPALVRAELARLDADPPYLVLALTEGPDLRTVLERSGPLELRQALAIARDLAHLLAHLHAQATYHRDLQPRNVVLSDQGPIVVGLGIAREEGKGMLTTPGTMLGDVRYAPPEWSNPEGPRPQQWDLYSLGLTLYAMLTGTEPFDIEEDLPEADRAVRLTKRKRQVPHLDPGDTFPDNVRELVRRLTAVDPERRPATAREVTHTLRELLEEVGADPGLAAGPPPTEEQAPPTAPPSPPSPPEPVAEPQLPAARPQRWPWWAPYAVALGGALALAAGMSLIALLAAAAAWLFLL